MKIQTYSNISETLLTDWQKLWQSSEYATIVNSPGRFLSAMKVFDYKEIKIVTIYKSDELVAIAPFVKTKIFGVALFALPVEEFADRPQILINYNEKKLVQLFFSKIAQLGTVLLPYFTSGLLDSFHKQTTYSKIFPGDVIPYINFSQGPYGNLSSRKRNIVINRLKNSEQKCTIEIVAKKPSESLEKAFDIDRASAKHNHGKGVFYRKEARDFYRELAQHNPANIIVTLVFFDNKPVSYLIGFFSNNIHSGSQKAYVSGYEYFNLGRLSLINLIDYFREKGSAEFDFGRGNDQFKKDFTSNYRQLYTVIITKNILLRNYITQMYLLHETMYKFLSRYPKIYKIYHRVKELLNK
jgi:hypothetical protein